MEKGLGEWHNWLLVLTVVDINKLIAAFWILHITVYKYTNYSKNCIVLL